MEKLKTEHGIFTDNEETGQTAEEVYQEWLDSKHETPIIEITLQERNRADIDYLAIMTGVDL